MDKVYAALKPKYPDAVLLFRFDDFYITYEEDAKILQTVCGFNKSFNLNKLDVVLIQLINAGHKVAVCEPGR